MLVCVGGGVWVWSLTARSVVFNQDIGGQLLEVQTEDFPEQALFLIPFKRVCGLGLMLSIWGLGFKVSTYARLSYEEAQSKVLLVMEQVLYEEHLKCYNSRC